MSKVMELAEHTANERIVDILFPSDELKNEQPDLNKINAKKERDEARIVKSYN